MHAWVPGCIHRVVVLFVVVASMKRVVIGCWMLLTEDGHGVVCVLTDDSALDMDDCFVGIRLSGQPPHCSTMGVRPTFVVLIYYVIYSILLGTCMLGSFCGWGFGDLFDRRSRQPRA